jgi:trans-aconitate methyltransferase
MPGWVSVFLWIAAGLFLLKMSYAFSVALALPFTQGALYVSSSRRRVAAFVDAVSMKPHQVFVDLGCGDGRVLRRVRRLYGVRAIGYELNLMAYAKARLMSIGSGVEIRWRNFWKVDLSRADVVFCYLYPDVLAPLGEKLLRELKPGTRVACCNFALPRWKPERVLRPGGGRHSDPIYLYRV